MTAEPNGAAWPTSPAGLPSDAETRTILERARLLRAEALAELGRTALARIGLRPAGAGEGRSAPSAVPSAGGMPHARA